MKTLNITFPYYMIRDYEGEQIRWMCNKSDTSGKLVSIIQYLTDVKTSEFDEEEFDTIHKQFIDLGYVKGYPPTMQIVDEHENVIAKLM